ncbi:MAG: transporter substrate-binding domain-containing protein, partial [Candidatus Marinimicrobia bacterium]|nr:transporter substrate-binding domain-containing protein [Candidatus Neomarinimicrobiota bacterium]
ADLRVTPRPVHEFRQDFCFAAKEGDAATLALLTEGLALITADGTRRALHSKWFAALELPSDRRLIVGGDHHYPPFEFLDANSRPAGLNVDLTRAIARELDLDVDIRLGPWAEQVQALERGEVDALQGVFYSATRDRRFDFSQPFMMAHYVSVVRRDAGAPPIDLADLAGRRVAVQRGDIIHEYLVEHGLDARIELFETQADALRAVATGAADCAVTIRVTALLLIEQNDWPELVLGGRPFLSLEYCYAVRAGNQALLAQIGEGLRMLEQNGTLRDIQRKWLGVYAPGVSRERLLRYAAWILTPLLVLLLAFLVWTRLLRREVGRQTIALRESEHLLVLADRLARLGGWRVDLGQERVIWSDEVAAIHDMPPGYSPTIEEGIAFYAPEHRERVRQVFTACAQEGTPYDEEVVLITRAGRRLWVRTIGVAERDAAGRIIRVTGAFQDITTRKQSEDRIAHLNRVLRAIRDINQLIVRERDRQKLIHEASRLLVAHRGYSSALIVLTDEQDGVAAWAASGLAGESSALQAQLERGERPACCASLHAAPAGLLITERNEICADCPLAADCTTVSSVGLSLTCGDRCYGCMMVAMEAEIEARGEERDLLEEVAGDLGYALRNLETEAARAAAENQRQNLAEQLAQAQKLESIGQLAGGVAHDFNNLLMGIMGYIELAQEQLAPEHPVRELLEEVMRNARRSADLTRQLLAFARKQTIAPRVLNLNAAVESMLKMLRRLIGEDIDLAWMPGAALDAVFLDPSQVDQVLANLCANARDAIGGVGKITIETRNVVFTEAYCARRVDCHPGEYVMLAVSDDGRGMAPEEIDRIFEPFYTTKESGAGSGLGLATVYGIVRQNNGFVNVYSEPGQGTTFRLYFSRSAEDAPPEDAAGSAEELPRARAGETILLVEDERSIRVTTQSSLERLGYQVLAAADSAAALLVAAAEPGPIHLLLTDVVLPGLSGRDLARELNATRPDMRCLYMSGYTANVIAHRGILEADVQFIAKPFMRDELARKVRAVLDVCF